MYVEIVNTGKYSLLNGLDYAEAWEEIVKKNGEATGNKSYGQFLDLSIKRLKYLNEYVIVRALLVKLTIREDAGDINELNKRGYKIDVADYKQTVENAFRKCNNLSTKIGTTVATLNKLTGDSKANISFDTLLAELSSSLGFVVNEDITLARYNEYNKVILKKKSNGRDNRR